MTIQIDPSALIAACKQGMTCTPTFIFWAVAAMAVIGLVQSVGLMREKEPPKDWKKPTLPEAPEGFRWVLVPDEK